MLYGFVRRLVRLSHLLDTRSRNDVRPVAPSGIREQSLVAIADQLSARGILTSRGREELTPATIKLLPTGSGVNVAIIHGGNVDELLVLKFTDSVVASAELAASSANQKELTADTRLTSWTSHIPQVLTSGLVGTTTFAVERCLSSRDGREVAVDPATTSALVTDALAVIDDFHRLGAHHRQVDAKILEAIVDRPIDVLRANTPGGVWQCRVRAIDRLSQWLRQSLLGTDLEVGWTHGDYHLGNVLIDDVDNHIVGVIDWGRAESDGLAVLDGCTLIILEQAKCAGTELGIFLLQLLNDVELAPSERVFSDALGALQALVHDESHVDLRCLLMLTWLKHVANNLKYENGTRSHALWRLRTVDLVLYGAAEAIGY